MKTCDPGTPTRLCGLGSLINTLDISERAVRSYWGCQLYPVEGFVRSVIVKFCPCAVVIDCPGVTFVLFVVFVIGTFSLVCVGAVVVLLLVLDVHPATTTVRDSSAIARPAMKTRFLSIISPLRRVQYMVMGSEAHAIHAPAFRHLDAKCRHIERAHVSARDDGQSGRSKSQISRGAFW